MNAVLNQAPAGQSDAAWTPVCPLESIVPNTGVCALVAGHPVAVFRVKAADGIDQLYALDNIDPKNGASVLSRGLVGNLGEHIVVASPLYKHHFVLATGACLESPDWSVKAHLVRVQGAHVEVALA
jgi:nitrite reductase (NADH) small subunit